MLDNCFRFAPRDSIPGLIAKICKYLKDHPGWSEEELEEQIKKFISATGVESFDGRTGTVTLDKNDVNNLKIASAYFAEGDESIDSLDLVSLYNQGVRFVFTDFNSVTSGYNLAFVLDYLSGSGDVVYYPMSTGSGGSGNIVSVNGKTGVVELSLADIIGTSGVQVKLCTETEFASANMATWNAYYNEGYRIIGVVNSSSTAIDYIYLLKQDGNNHTPIGLSTGASDAYTPANPPPYPVTSVNGKTGVVTGLYDQNNQPPYPVNKVNNKTGSVSLKVVDVSNGNSSDENAYIFIDENEEYPEVVSADSEKLGGKAPKYYIQTRNLLDNSDFTNPVNQRGKTMYTGGYGIDRWKQWNNSNTTTINDNSISISIIQQYIGTNIDFNKTYTIAAKKVDGSILCESGTFNVKLNKNGLRIDYDTNTDGTKKPYIAINNAGDYVWAALYEGSYTAKTLPPYVPKGYAAEFAECRRYYKRFTSPNAAIICAGYVTGGTKFIYFNSPDNYPMRIDKPSCTFTGVITVRGTNGYIAEDYSGGVLTVYAKATGCISMMELTRGDSSEWNATNNTPVFVNFHGNSVLELIADL